MQFLLQSCVATDDKWRTIKSHNSSTCKTGELLELGVKNILYFISQIKCSKKMFSLISKALCHL